ncbi:uncharacterized protein EV420DRAFT_1654915 [Desarmillaria tabescens]|uniref:Uncharacterized protein n=1 Tax=Armillaria tabescens TaxID=1929756 RepID=A0AA39J0Q6_ARMTA|nr:uncharacterized protein EV420DRAFT_1654915 [Desarmillaria tabescens]KAK0433137.1 hypothetical protein EV420DRAFT_1654915 [Desarmillaria tabescens]
MSQWSQRPDWTISLLSQQGAMKIFDIAAGPTAVSTSIQAPIPRRNLVATTSPLCRLTTAGLLQENTPRPNTQAVTLPQPFVRPETSVAGLLSHGFNSNTFLGTLPMSSRNTAFIGSNTTGRKKASAMRMAWGHGEAPTCHVLIYPFLSPEHRQQAIKDADPSVQTGYPLPQSDIYHLEHVDVTPFREHMQKLDLCITFYTNANNNYRMIHNKLLTHNAMAGKPQILGLKTDDLANLSFQNMGWCFLQLMSHKGDPSLLVVNKKINEGQATIDHFICHGSLESKFLPKHGKNHSAVLGQFTLVIALTRGPICHNLRNRNLYVGDFGLQGMPDVVRGGMHACFSERAMHNLLFVMRQWGSSFDENSLPSLRACRGLPPNHLAPELMITAGIPRCPQLTDDATSLAEEPQPNTQSNKRPASSRSPPPDRLGMRPLSPIDSSSQLPPLPLPPPYYAGEIWPQPRDAERVQSQPIYTSCLSETMISLLPDTMCLKGPNVESLADAVLELCRFYATNAWDKDNEMFLQKIEGPLAPQFPSSDILCENWDELAKFGSMKMIILQSRSHGDGINKMVLREALKKALENTNLYTSLPNNSNYFTATFRMRDCTAMETCLWRAQGLLLALCTVTFRMPPLPVSPFLFLALLTPRGGLAKVLDLLTGPVVKALDPATEDFMQPWLGFQHATPHYTITHEISSPQPYDVGFKKPDPEKSQLQNRLVLKLILLSHPMADQSNGFNAMREGFSYNFGHDKYIGGLPSLFRRELPQLENLLLYLHRMYDRSIHSAQDLLDLIQFDHGCVRTDAFCSTPCDWGYGTQPNGGHLPLYECVTRAITDKLRKYFEQDLDRCGPRFLVMATSLPYMPAAPEEKIKFVLHAPDEFQPPSQVFRMSTCFNIIRLKLDMKLCSLLAGEATALFLNFEACLDFWLFDDDRIVMLI